MNKIKYFFGTLWCWGVHFWMNDAWEMPYPYAPWKCRKCGRRWEL